MIKFTAPEDRIIRRVTDGVTDRVTDRVTEAEMVILTLLDENPSYTYAVLSEKTGMSRKTIAARIKSLKEKGIIKRIGSDYRGHWEITE